MMGVPRKRIIVKITSAGDRHFQKHFLVAKNTVDWLKRVITEAIHTLKIIKYENICETGIEIVILNTKTTCRS